jgi:flagellar biosynthesis/type III secretory pathway M-ring protein FliF/YscJ
MDVLKAQLDRIQRQLAGLTATQKMLTAALVAIMAITVVWWGKYAGESETVPLSSQSFSAAELGRISDQLDRKNYRYTVSGDKILVPAEQRVQILAYLIYSKAMPRGTHQAMEEILKQRNVFDSETTTERIWNHGKEALLSEMIGSFEDVETAAVIVNPTEQYRVGASLEPTATVNITTAPNVKNLESIADAAAEIVSGAQSNLTRKNIKVVINGVAQQVSDSETDTVNANKQLQLRQQYEAYAEDHVRKFFSIPGLQVAVSMKINTTSLVKDQTEYDAKNVVQKETQSNSETDETNTAPPPPGGEAGAVPNTGANANSQAGGGSQSQNHEKQDQKFDVKVPETITHSKTLAGDLVPLGATVRVPISYFQGIYQHGDSSTPPPTPKQLDTVVAAELPLLREQVVRTVGLQSIDQVASGPYIDPPPLARSQITGGATASGTGMVSVLVSGHAKEIALGALALMSLFMASMMVRKGQPAPVPALPAAQQLPVPGPTPILMAGEPLAGEAGSGDALLDGMELNEDAIKAQQMVDQVSTMVRENPDAAATLVKRWLNRT